MWSTQLLEFQHNDVQLYCRAEGTPKPQISWLTSSGDLVQNDGKFEVKHLQIDWLVIDLLDSHRDLLW